MKLLFKGLRRESLDKPCQSNNIKKVVTGEGTHPPPKKKSDFGVS